MQRLRQRQCEEVAKALSLIPDRIVPFVNFDLFCGDPIFSGVLNEQWHNWVIPGYDFFPDRSLRDTPHVEYSFHARDKRQTIVLQRPIGIYNTVHEIGHIVQGSLVERMGTSKHLPVLCSITRYADTNYDETFAEAFAAYILYRPRTIDRNPKIWPGGWVRENDEYFARLGRP